MAAPEDKTVRLRGSDGEAVEVSEKVITAASSTVKGVLESGGPAAAGGVVELPDLAAATLSRVVEYVKRHFEGGVAPPDEPSFFGPSDDDPLARFDDELVAVGGDALVDLVHAADLLKIGRLKDLACRAVAEQMKGKSIEEIRKVFGIVNDYTKEEEEEVRRENSWAFD